MHKFCIDELVDMLQEEFYDVNIVEQEDLKDMLSECYSEFPMISFEKTDDSSITVDVDESKFLNDSEHNGIWFVVYANGCDDILCVFNMKDNSKYAEIDTLEIAEKFKNLGYGREVVSIIECACEDYYTGVCVSPFDTSAINFWEYLGYTEKNNGYWYKELSDEI